MDGRMQTSTLHPSILEDSRIFHSSIALLCNAAESPGVPLCVVALCVALRYVTLLLHFLCWRWRPPRRPRRWRLRGVTAPPSAPGTASTTLRSTSTLLLRLPPAPTPPPLPLKPIAIAAVAAAATSIAAAPVVMTSDAVAAPPSGSTAGASQLCAFPFSPCTRYPLLVTSCGIVCH